MPGYGSRKPQAMTDERKAMHEKQVEKLNTIAKAKAKILYDTFVESLKEEDCSNLSADESVALATLTGGLFSASVVYGFYFDLIERGLQLAKKYSPEDMEREIVNAAKSYSGSFEKSLQTAWS